MFSPEFAGPRPTGHISGRRNETAVATATDDRQVSWDSSRRRIRMKGKKLEARQWPPVFSLLFGSQECEENPPRFRRPRGLLYALLILDIDNVLVGAIVYVIVYTLTYTIKSTKTS